MCCKFGDWVCVSLQAFLLKNILFSRESSKWRQMSGRFSGLLLFYAVMFNSDLTTFWAIVCVWADQDLKVWGPSGNWWLIKRQRTGAKAPPHLSDISIVLVSYSCDSILLQCFGSLKALDVIIHLIFFIHHKLWHHLVGKMHQQERNTLQSFRLIGPSLSAC